MLPIVYGMWVFAQEDVILEQGLKYYAKAIEIKWTYRSLKEV